MHGDSFLLAPPSMILLQDVRSLDRFPICLEACNNSIDMFKSLLGNSPLCFNSSFLPQPQFDSLMEQILGE